MKLIHEESPSTLIAGKVVEQNEFLPVLQDKVSHCMHVRIKVMHAVSHPEVARVYCENHKERLNQFEVGDVSSIHSWRTNPHSYMLIAECADGKEIGAGIRLDVADPAHPIPLEEAVSPLNPEIVPAIHKYNDVLAESCGLWVNRKFNKRNLAGMLIRASISIATKLKVKKILVFSHQFSKKIFTDLGFKLVKKFFNQAEFPYPDDRYTSSLLELDLYDLSGLTCHEDEKIHSLCCQPLQHVMEEYNGYRTKVEYDLRLI